MSIERVVYYSMSMAAAQVQSPDWAEAVCVKSFISYLPYVGWFPPGTPVSSTIKLILSSFHRLDMTLVVAEALNPNKTKPNQTQH